MCFACLGGHSPYHRPHDIAPPPTKEEDVYLDQWTNFYPDYRQGIHPPGPVYQGHGFGYAGHPGYSGMYPAASLHHHGAMYGGMHSPYYMNHGMNPYNSAPYLSSFLPTHPFSAVRSQFYHNPFVPNFMSNWAINYSPWSHNRVGYGGHPNAVPQPKCPAAMTSQAAAAAAANKQIAEMHEGPNYYVGATPTEMASQQAIVAANIGHASAGASSMAPYKPSDGQQFWCRELDGSWTLRTYSSIALGDVSPGHWERHTVSGYYFWVRQPA